MRYISLFSGIECASLAAKPLGWEPICFSEIEPFPSAVLAHHYPDIPNVGDMTEHDWSQYRGICDLVIGGSPCQAFSVAGRRESLSDARGNLTLSFVEAVNAINPAFVVWENVPGVLSTRDNAFGCFLAALAGHDFPLDTPEGERWTDAGVVIGPRRYIAWRILDAQYFGVPQRRRRVFLVGCTLTSGIDPSEILFEREGMRGDSAARREAGKDIAGSTAKCLTGSNQRIDYETETLVTAPLTARQYSDNASQESRLIAFHGSQDPDVSGDVTHPVGRNQGLETCVAFAQNQCGDVLSGDVFGSLGTNQNAAGRNTAKVLIGGKHATEDEADPGEVLSVLREKAGKKAATLRGLGVPDSFSSQKILRHGVYGEGLRPSGDNKVSMLDDGSLPCAQRVPQRAVRSLREGEVGSTSQRHGLAKQQSREPGPSLPEMPSTSSPGNLAVRRLLPVETERLQGIPDDHTLVPWRGGMAPDGPRYKAIGNGMAVPCVRWIFERIEECL